MTAYPPQVPKKKTGLIIGIICGAAAFIAALVICLIIFLKPNSNSGTFEQALPNSNVQANMASWGLAAFDGQTTYISDNNTGIYTMDTTGQKTLFLEGVYSELGLLGDTLFCVEYVYYDDPSLDRCYVIGIDLSTKRKKLVYEAPSAESELIGANVLDNYYYFTLDSDTLYVVNEKGQIQDTKLRSVYMITDTGVYCSGPDYMGLKLVAPNGQTLTTYPTLDEYYVSVYFELDQYVYIGLSKDYEYFQMCRMNKYTGELKPLTQDASIFADNWLSYVNYYEDTLYVSTSIWYEDNSIDYAVYSMDFDGTNVKPIFTYTDNCGWGVPFCTLNISDHYLIISAPVSEMEPEIIDLNR